MAFFAEQITDVADAAVPLYVFKKQTRPAVQGLLNSRDLIDRVNLFARHHNFTAGL